MALCVPTLQEKKVKRCAAFCVRAAVTTCHVFSSLADQTRSLAAVESAKKDRPSRGVAPEGSSAHRSEVEASLPMKLITDFLGA